MPRTPGKKLLRPRALEIGGTIGIVAPGSPPGRRRLRAGVAFLKQQGFKVKIHSQCYRSFGFLAGRDEVRAQALHAMFADPDIDAILCARGGVGCLRLLPLLDFGLIRRNPKIFVGYSDLTALHLAIYQRCRLVTLHGPMVASELGPKVPHFTARHLFRSLRDGRPPGVVSIGGKRKPFTIIRPGCASGPLLGGNLSLVCRLVGSGYLPDFAGALLFLEDINEEPYRIDNFLSQLRLSGILNHVAGVVFGNFVDCEPEDAEKPSFSLREVLFDHFSHMPYPVIWGVPFGHGKKTITIPHGVQGTVDTRARRFSIDEAAVTSA